MFISVKKSKTIIHVHRATWTVLCLLDQTLSAAWIFTGSDGVMAAVRRAYGCEDGEATSRRGDAGQSASATNLFRMCCV